MLFVNFHVLMKSEVRKCEQDLTEYEYAHFKKCVTRSGYSADGYIRSLIMGSIPREPPPIEYRQMINELRAIGNAMNQIAARANATGFFLVEEYAANAIRLANTVTSIREAVCMPDRIT